MKEVILFIFTFLACLGILFGWYYLIKQKEKSDRDLKSIKRSNIRKKESKSYKKPYKVTRPDNVEK